MIRVDLHVHSSASPDCTVEPGRVAARCRQLGLSPVFLTDHDTIAGAAHLRAGKVRVVAGEEVMTTEGELIGLFLERPIRSGLTPKETALEIKGQGGLVYLEHSYDPFRRHLSESSIETLADLIDIVELFNARSKEEANRRAEDLCSILGAAPGAGSDAHSLKAIGIVYVEMEDFEGAQDFLASCATGRSSSAAGSWLTWPRQCSGSCGGGEIRFPPCDKAVVAICRGHPHGAPHRGGCGHRFKSLFADARAWNGSEHRRR